MSQIATGAHLCPLGDLIGGHSINDKCVNTLMIAENDVKNVGAWWHCWVHKWTYHISGFTVVWDTKFVNFWNEFELEFSVTLKRKHLGYNSY